MSGQSRIIAFGSAEEEAQDPGALHPADLIEARTGDTAPDEPLDTASGAEASAENQWFAARLPFALAGCAALAWTGFFIWARLPAIVGGSSPAEFAAMIAQWAVPALLVGMLLLIYTRNSRREAVRFGEVARILSDESQLLEARLLTVNRELSLAREFLASQSRDLDSLGRIATERLSQHADRLQTLIRDNGSRVETIGTVSETALENMEKLRGQLPVIASSAKDVTNNIGTAGRTAHSQLEDMVAGFNRLNEFGQASERQVHALKGVIEGAIGDLDEQCSQLEQAATAKFTELSELSTEFRSQLESQETESLASIRHRAAALLEELHAVQGDLDGHEEASLTSLRARFSALRDESQTMSRSLRDSQDRAIQAWKESLSGIARDKNDIFAEIEEADRLASDQFRERLAAIDSEIAALDEKLAERRQQYAEEVEGRRTALEDSEGAAIARLGNFCTEFDRQLAERSAGQERHAESLTSLSESLTSRFAAYEERLAEIGQRAAQTEERMEASLRALSERLSSAQNDLAGTGQGVARLTDESVRLLEIIQATTVQTQENLPASLQHSEHRLAALEPRVADLLEALETAGAHGQTLVERISETDGGIKSIVSDIEHLHSILHERGDAYRETLESLRDALKSLEEQNQSLSEQAQGELTAAIERLSDAAKSTSATIEETGAASVSALAERLSKESSAAIEKVIRTKAAEASGQLEQAASHAAGVSREATVQLRDQLTAVNELVGNLEQRVAQARARAEEQVDNDFARRAALLTESLNSNAIDIAKALSTDVSDTAWAAYLRGDRGIFTRRAVSLLENSEVKAIQQIFERDGDFREHVSRYVHDFEAILRQVLSTRDGTAIGVTLLSSDMGKLYVALAQGIERLRK